MADPVIITALDNSGKPYEMYSHPAFTSCEISGPWHQASGRPGSRVKNLFLRNKNGKRHFLLMLPPHLEFDKALFKQLTGEKCGMASDDRLWEYLQTRPGAVSPLCLVHDKNHEVELYLESSLMAQPALHLHPGHSEMSVQITPHDFQQFMSDLGCLVHIVDWDSTSSPD